MKQTALFICVHNSARSQMAEAFTRALCGEFFDVQSAGLQPGRMNPVVVEAMQELGIDLSQKTTQGVDDLLRSSARFDYVVTVCDESDAAGCPVFPGPAKRLHWPFRDPSKLTGSDADKLCQVRKIRDQIRMKVEEWCEQVCPSNKAYEEIPG